MKIFVAMLLLAISLFGAVNINKASKEELMSIKGIGEKKAKAIVDYRKKHGKFKTINDLQSVKGIGPKFISKHKKEITVK
jgi:competence protein ComEA